MQPAKRRINCFVCGSTLLASLSSLLLGYDIGIMSGAIIYIEKVLDLTTWEVEIIVASLNLVSGVGGLFAGKISDACGRKTTILVASVLFMGGAVLMAVAESFGVLLVGRLVTGLGVGAGLVIAPMYTAELSPPEHRGRLVSMMEIAINLGILLGYVAAFALSGLPDSVNWRYMLGIGSIPAFLLLLSVALMSESPRWLIAQNRITEAAGVLSMSCVDGEEVRLRIAEVKQTLAMEASAEVPGWSQVLCPAPGPMRRIILVAILLNFFQQGTGIEAAVYFTPHTLQEAGITDDTALLGATVAVGAAKTIVICIAAPLLDRYGRRPLLLLSAVGMVLSLSLLGISFAIGSPVALALTAQILFVSAFSIGFGPANWIVLSEICPLQVRGRAMSLGALVNRITSGTVALTFLSFADAITRAGAFFFYAAIAVVATAWVWFYVPETKGKTLEQIEAEFRGQQIIVEESDKDTERDGDRAAQAHAHADVEQNADSANFQQQSHSQHVPIQQHTHKHSVNRDGYVRTQTQGDELPSPANGSRTHTQTQRERKGSDDVDDSVDLDSEDQSSALELDYTPASSLTIAHTRAQAPAHSHAHAHGHGYAAAASSPSKTNSVMERLAADQSSDDSPRSTDRRLS